MKELVLDLINSYENRISAVEEWITTAYQAVEVDNEGFGALDEERDGLTTSLQEILVRNCSLRRKDFWQLMGGILSDCERKRAEIDEDRKRIIEKIKWYLGEQKGLATSLRRQLSEPAPEKPDNLDAVIDNIKVTYQDTGHLFAMLREFQSRMLAFRREQEEMNRGLKRLVDRGELLQTEDLRELRATEARQNRRAERETRRNEVAGLLADFKKYRRNPPLTAANKTGG